MIKESLPYAGYLSEAAAFMFAAFTSLFSVVNPLAAMPVFLSLTENDTKVRRNLLARKAATYMFVVLIVFLVAGTYIMSFFGISLPGIRIAGGLIIMSSAYSMLKPVEPGRKMSDEDEEAARAKNDISFSPLAMPLLSGPGSIAVVIGLATQASTFSDYLIITGSILLVALISYAVLRIAPWATRWIGRNGMNVLTRLMGFIALSIAVQFILTGISSYFGLG